MALGKRRHGYSSRESGGGKKVVIFLLIFGLLGYFGYRKYISINLGKANAFLYADDYEKSETYFQRIASFPLSKGKGEDGLGALDLLRGDLDDAREHFKVVLAHKPSLISGAPDIILQKFIDRGNYENARIYRDFLLNWSNADALKPYSLEFAAIALGTRDLAEARKYLDGAPAALREGERHATLNKLIGEYEQSRKLPVLIDRNGAAVMHFDLAEDRYDFVSPKLFAGWDMSDAEGSMLKGMDPNDLFNRIETSLDINLQKAAHQAMQGYQGTMVLLDPKSGDILAAYGTEGMNPFTTTFEPGSVIKVLTYGLYLQEGGNTDKYAPKTYPGNMKIGGRIFYDWTTQGKLETVDEGMAVSCNLMFAQMGIDLGWPKLSKGLKHLFNGTPVPGLPGQGIYGKMETEPENAWEMGRAAIGLDFPAATSLGLAIIPGVVANQGTLSQPRLIQRHTNQEHKVYKTVDTATMSLSFSPEVSASMMQSMRASMDGPRGTARRARVDFVNAAMKTGTAGERPFDSIMIGAFPVEQPKVVFAFYLGGGGKCEINGARVARYLQEQIKALAPEYMEKAND